MVPNPTLDRYTAAERAAYRPSPCHVCGGFTVQTWIEVPVVGDGPEEPRWAIAAVRCIDRCITD